MLQKSGRGYFVVNERTGRRLSKKPLSKVRASAQMRAVYAREGGYKLNCSLSKNRSYRTCQKRSSMRGGRKMSCMAGGRKMSCMAGGRKMSCRM